MATISEIVGKSGSIFSKISEVVGEVGGWMNVLGLGRSSSGRSPSAGGENKQEAGLKANVFGIGTKDETLFWEAVALAEAKQWMKYPEGQQNLSKIFAGLGYWEKPRFYHMIGQDSQSVVIEGYAKSSSPPSVDPMAPLAPRRRSRTTTPDPSTANPDEPKSEKTTMFGNIRGAMIAAFFANMDPADALVFLKNSGTLNGTTDDIGEVYKKLSEFLGTVGAKMNVKSQATLLQYFGATDIAEAKNNVAEREAETARLRKQSWYERNLQSGPGLTRVWVGLAAIIVLGSVYMFALN